MKQHASLVLIPIDDVTNQVIKSNSITPQVCYEKPALWKSGFYIFMNVKQKEFTVHIESQVYQSQDFKVNLQENETIVRKIRMSPNRTYPCPKSFTVLRGKGVPDESVLAVNEESVQSFRLQKDIKPGEPCAIYHPDNLDLSGKKIILTCKGEHFQAKLSECLEEEVNTYPITGLGDDYAFRKSEVMIHLCYGTKVSGDGSFYLLIPKGIAKESKARIWYRGREREISILCEEENIVDLEEQEGGR